jgi:hypothetical protein
MPAMADFWPDRASGAQPPQPTIPRHAAESSPDPDDAGVAAPAEHPRRARLTLGGAVALALLVVVGGVLAVFVRQASSEPAGSSAAPAISPEASAASPVPTGPASVAPAPTVTSAPPLAAVLPPRDASTTPPPKLPAAATFEVAASARSVTVRSQNLGADLYRVTLAKSAAPVTAKVGDAGPNHRLTLVKDDQTVAPPVTITLNTGVRWSLKLTAGNTETSVNLTQSNLASLELAGGAHAFTLTLPQVTGTLPLRVTHGMNQLKIDTNGVPVRATLRVGAGKVILDGVTRTDTKPGKVLTSDGWSGAADRVDIDSVEGVGTLTVDTD